MSEVRAKDHTTSIGQIPAPCRLGAAAKLGVLWVDLRGGASKESALHSLGDVYAVHWESQVSGIPAAVRRVDPVLICFEYDQPDAPGLTALQQTRMHYPSLPVVMLTEQSSEALAVWAFRSGVRDYLVKPIEPEDLVTRIELFSDPGAASAAPAPEASPMPLPPIPPDVGGVLTLVDDRSRHKATAAAVSHVEDHFHERISLDQAARLCGMGRFEFSRAFRKEHGLPFRDFLVRYRIVRAQDLLKDPRVAVSGVAEAVGFRDLTHFARMFRRLVGTTPSAYKRGRGRLGATVLACWQTLAELLDWAVPILV